MTVDFVGGWLRDIGGTVPPFCVELVLRDGTRHYVHSISQHDDESRTVVVRIWDLRALSDSDLEQLKQRLNSILDRSKLNDERSVHPKLDWANLRIHYEDVMYCIEWHDRLWPDEAKPRLGFAGPP